MQFRFPTMLLSRVFVGAVVTLPQPEPRTLRCPAPHTTGLPRHGDSPAFSVSIMDSPVFALSDHYIERLDTAETPHDKSQVMNWALNALACNITPNLRLDLIANAQAELASVAK